MSQPLSRRQLLTGLAASLTLPGSAALAYPAEPYAPTTWPDLRDSNERVVLNFRASWSLTCQIKHDLITTLLQDTPEFGTLKFVDVDWDTFGRSEWVQRRLKVERRSTLIALRGKTEIARLVNQPYERRLRSFLDQAVSA